VQGLVEPVLRPNPSVRLFGLAGRQVRRDKQRGRVARRQMNRHENERHGAEDGGSRQQEAFDDVLSHVPITLKHVGELFDVRLLLEPPAARRAAGRVDAERLRTLDELCQAQYRVGDRESAATFLSVNTEFHVAVAEASGNSLQASMIRGLLDKVERVHHLGHLLHDRNQDAYHEHHDLLEALLAGDGDRAEQIMVDQIVAAKRFAIDAMVNSASLSTVNVSVR
jgi:DNA-binding FadR family transcriptional regulator